MGWQKNIGEASRRLLDPATTLLFVFGSIVLGVLSNSAYDLVLEWLASTPIQWLASQNHFVSVFVGSLAILAVVVLLLVAWINRPRPKLNVALSAERQADGVQGLLLLVSPGDIEHTSEKVAIEHHLTKNMLRHCWLITSPETVRSGKIATLETLLKNNKVTPHLVSLADGYQAKLAYTAVEHALNAAQQQVPNGSIAVDITGGTKPMTSGAVLACFANGISMEYVLGKYNEKGERDPRVGSVVMKVDQAWS